MTAPVGNRLTRLADWSLPAKSSLLVLAIAILYGGVATLAWVAAGSVAPIAAAVAAGACVAGAIVALIIVHVCRSPQLALYGLLLGMAARMGLPLVVALAFWRHGGALAEAGLLYYLLIFYPITLGLETLLSLPSPRDRVGEGTDG
jgi:hypothetical protein